MNNIADWAWAVLAVPLGWLWTRQNIIDKQYVRRDEFKALREDVRYIRTRIDDLAKQPEGGRYARNDPDYRIDPRRGTG